MTASGARPAPPRPRLGLALIPYTAVSLAYLVGTLLPDDTVTTILKPALMPALALGLILATPRRNSAATLLALLGVSLSWLGDITLGTFVVGLSFFLLAHVAYIVLFVREFHGRVARWTPVYLVWFGLLVWLLAPFLGALIVPVIAYGLVLAAMAATATRGGGLLATGGALFVVSDSLLSIHLFLPNHVIPLPSFLIMLTYTLAQGLIVAAVVRSQRGAGAG